MQIDDYEGMSHSPISPAEYCFAITPSDVEILERATKAIYVGTSGSVAIRCVRGGNDVIFENVLAGSILDLRVKAVLETGTTATNIVGLA